MERGKIYVMRNEERIDDAILSAVELIVDEPRKVEITCYSTEYGVQFHIKVAKADVSRLTGHNGQTIEAFRFVASAAGAHIGKTVSVELRALLPGE